MERKSFLAFKFCVMYNRSPYHFPHAIFRPHYRPHSPTSEDSNHFGSSSFSNSQDTTEFDMESFQSHREQLLQMQREQQEQLLRQQTSDLDTSFNGLEHSFSSQPSSRFTLDTASAKFAVSAVMNSSQIQQQESATSTSSLNGASSILTSSISLTNGPITSSSDSEYIVVIVTLFVQL